MWVLKYLSHLKNIEWLLLNNTKIGDDGLKQLKDLSKLQTLSLNCTMVTDIGLGT